jgi:serine/threonine-protein kinase
MTNENDLKVGDILGGFKIEKVLGRGGMGVVFKAHELSLNRKIALKVLASRLSADEEFIQRFKREAQVIAALRHPNIVNILSYGQDQELHYFAMEYIQGEDLGEVLRRKGKLPYDEALSMVRQVADALSEAGAKGVVHRDIKPSNIMIDPVGRAFVTDFGVAHFADASNKLTQTGLFLGTPEYSSPEQATGKSLDVRSDIYSLGAVLYRMISGRPPVSGESPLAVMVKISTEPVTPIGQVNPDVPQPIRDLLSKMMAKDLNERYQEPQTLITDIDRCRQQIKGAPEEMRGLTTALQEPTLRPPPAPPRRSKVGVVGGILGIALAVVLVVWVAEGQKWFQITPPPASPKIAMESSVPPPMEKSTPIDAASTPAASTPNIAAVTPAQETNGTVTPVEQKSIPEPSGEEKPATASPASEKSREPSAEIPPVKAEKPITVPKRPTVLAIVHGEEAMVSAARPQVYAALKNSGLKVLTYAEVPVLREKVRVGSMPITWYDIKRIAPPGQAQVLVLGEMVRTGSMPIRYMGRADEMTLASFALQAVDMASGETIYAASTDDIKFTAMTMNQKIKEGVAAAAQNIDTEIDAYWRKKSAAR